MRGISAPAWVLGLVVALSGAASAGEGPVELGDAELKPLIEKFREGEINWQEGAYYATVEVPYQKKVGARTVPVAYQKVIAERVAKAEADKVFVTLAAKIRIDADRTMRDVAAADAKIRIYGNVVGRQTVKLTHARGRLTATFKVDMRGVGSVTSKLYRVIANSAAERKPARRKVEVAGGADAPAGGDAGEGGPAGAVVVIDARGTGCRPAVFPKIVGDDGEVIHDATTIEADTAVRDGVVSYAVADAGDQAALPRGDGFIVLRAVCSDDFQISQCAEAGGAPEAKPKRRRRRRSVIKASEVVGKLKTDIVISKAAADRLKKDDAKQALASSRVIVVTDTTVGGTEGRLLPRAADLYAMAAGGPAR